MTTFRRHLALRCHWVLLLPALFGACHSVAQSQSIGPEQLIGASQQFLEELVSAHLQRSSIQGRHEVEISRLDPRLRLAECTRPLEFSLQGQGHPVGRLSLRVRCTGTTPWALLVPAHVRLYQPVVTLVHPLQRNSLVQASDISLVEQDVSLLRQGFITETQQVIGQKLTRNLGANQILTPSHLQQAEAVRKGEHVVISAGTGSIKAKMPGEALSDGAVGQQIRVRNLRSERIIRARVTGPGQVEAGM